MKVLILAAGYGTRLAAVAKDMPKPLIPINGRPLIDYVVDKIAKIPGLSEVVVVSNNKFTGHFQQWGKTRQDVRVRVVNDGTNTPEERLGSVGDINFVWVREAVLDDWLIVGGDNLFDQDLGVFMLTAVAKAPAITIGVYDIKDIAGATKFGVVGLDANNKVVEFQEKPAQPVSSLITMCLYYFPKVTLAYLPEYLSQSKALDAAGSYIQWLSQKKTVYGFNFQGKWYDIGSVQDLEEAQKNFK